MMEIQEAQDAVSGSEPRHLFEELRGELANALSGHPQRAQLAVHAMNLIEEGVQHLANLGHNFHLVRGPTAPPVQYPKMLYSKDGTVQLLVNSEEIEKAALGKGWEDRTSAPAKSAPGWSINSSTTTSEDE